MACAYDQRRLDPLTWLALRAPFWSCLLANTSRMESRSSSSCSHVMNGICDVKDGLQRNE